MSARDAAVRAVRDGRCVLRPNEDECYSHSVGKHPECSIAALATSADVRAGLVDALVPLEEYQRDGRLLHENAQRRVDAVLAALGGGE